jgi:AcrR family transcriptional regulator
MPARTRLDTATVVKTAADLVDKEGLEALTLNRLSEVLGIQTPSLYNHVQGMPGLRRELNRLNAQMLAERLGEAAIGKSGAEGLVSVAQAFRAYIHEHPGLYLANLGAAQNQKTVDTELQSAEERVLRIVLAVIASFGLSGEEALHAVRGLRSAVHGFATLEVAGGFGLPLDCDESFRRLLEMLIRGFQRAAIQGSSDRLND